MYDISALQSMRAVVLMVFRVLHGAMTKALVFLSATITSKYCTEEEIGIDSGSPFKILVKGRVEVQYKSRIFIIFVIFNFSQGRDIIVFPFHLYI